MRIPISRVLLSLLTPLFLTATLGIVARSQSISPLDYYPLQNGNVWVYMCYSHVLKQKTDTVYYTVTVVGDTIMPNTVKYSIVQANIAKDSATRFILPTFPYNLTYERLDSSTASSYRYIPGSGEKLLDSLNIKSATNQQGARTSFSTVFGPYLDTIFGLTIHVRDYQGPILPHDFLSYRLAAGFGLVTSRWEYTNALGAGFDSHNTTLVYAIINGVVFGNLPTSVDLSTEEPTKFLLGQNYPNPFNAVTTIPFHLPVRSNVTISVFDILGRQVTMLVDQVLNSGEHNIPWDASNSPSGTYFCRMRADRYTSTRVMLVLK